MHITPILKDKRLLLVAAEIILVLVLVACEREPSEGVLAYLGVVTSAYLAQSQWGQTKRALGVGE